MCNPTPVSSVQASVDLKYDTGVVAAVNVLTTKKKFRNFRARNPILKGGLWRHIRILRKLSIYPTIWPLSGQIVFILLFFQEKNIFPRLWRHMRGKIAVFASKRTYNRTNRLPSLNGHYVAKNGNFYHFFAKNIFFHGFGVISVKK